MPHNLDHLQLPLIVVEGLDVTLFGSVEALQGELEAIDVRQGTYVAYDREGRLLNLGVSPPTKRRRILGLTLDTTPAQLVVVEGAETQPGHEHELRRILIDFLDALGEEVDPEGIDLPELVQRASVRVGVSTR